MLVCLFCCFVGALGGVIYSSAVDCLDGCFFVVALGGLVTWLCS